MDRTKGTLLVMASVTVAILLVIAPTGSAENIDEVDHSPLTVTSDNRVTVTVGLDRADNITSVEIQVCIIEPTYNCYMWEPMVEGATHISYTYEIGKHSGGSLMGYKIKVEYDNGSGLEDEFSPSEDSYHEYDIAADVSSDDGGDDTPFVGAPLIAAGVVVAVVFHHKRRA